MVPWLTSLPTAKIDLSCCGFLELWVWPGLWLCVGQWKSVSSQYHLISWHVILHHVCHVFLAWNKHDDAWCTFSAFWLHSFILYRVPSLNEDDLGTHGAVLHRLRHWHPYLSSKGPDAATGILGSSNDRGSYANRQQYAPCWKDSLPFFLCSGCNNYTLIYLFLYKHHPEFNYAEMNSKE